MSKVVKGAKKLFKKAKNFVKDHWKKIAMVGVGLFTAGIGMAGGFGNFMSMASQGTGFWGTVGSTIKAAGSTMWAGATGVAGTFGIGPGASGAFAQQAGIQGGTLLNTGLAQSVGLASPGGGAGAAANVGTYTGPGASFMGGNGSLFGGAAGAPPPAMSPVQTARPLSDAANQVVGGPMSPAAPAGNTVGKTVAREGVREGVRQGGNSLVRDMAVAATPSLIQGVGAGLAAKAEEEAAKPRALWGYDIEGGTGYAGLQNTQNMNNKQTVTGPDGKEYEPDGQGGWRPAGITFGLQPVGLMDMAGGRG